MKLTQFMATLMPSFTKDTILEEFEDVQKQINQIDIPLFEKAMKGLSRHRFASEFAEGMGDSLFDGLKVKRYPNFIGGFLDITKGRQEQLSVIERLIEQHFELDVSTHAMNLHRINILQYVPVMNFVCRYMRAFTNYAISLEINHLSDSPEPVFDLIPADRDWLSRHRNTFLESVRVVKRRGDNLEKVFADLPDMAIDPQNAKIVEQTQGGAADPMGLGFIPLSINPIFHIRKMVMNIQVERYHLAKAEYDVLQRKVYNLKLINDGRNDAKLQREIRYTEEQRLRPLNHKIQKWEQDYIHAS